MYYNNDNMTYIYNYNYYNHIIIMKRYLKLSKGVNQIQTITMNIELKKSVAFINNWNNWSS